MGMGDNRIGTVPFSELIVGITSYRSDRIYDIFCIVLRKIFQVFNVILK